jgi:hypothetical protein
MKTAILTDLHFGARNDSLIFHDYFAKFYSELFFPMLDKYGIKHVICLGDLVDRRKFINFNILNRIRQDFIHPLEARKITMDVILGNHDVFFKNTNEINAIQELFGRSKYIKCYSEATEVTLEGDKRPILYVPWINIDNYDRTMKKIKETKAKVCMGHLELAGFQMYRGIKNENGMDPKIFKKFSQVFSGHYHHKSDNGKIFYLGPPYEMTFADINDPKGFHFYNTASGALKFIQNPNRMFHKIYYDDRNKELKDLIDPSNFEKYRGTYLKVIVSNKTNPFFFDKFVDKLTEVQPADVSIIEDFSAPDEDVSIDLAEDTLTILGKYVDDLELDIDKQKIKDQLHTLYLEAQNADRETE